MKKLALTLFAPFLMCSLFAMEEMQNPLDYNSKLIGPVGMNYLKTKAAELHQQASFHIRIEENDDVIEKDAIIDSSQLPKELTVEALRKLLSELTPILISFLETHGSLKISVNGHIPGDSYRVTGYDFIETRKQH